MARKKSPRVLVIGSAVVDLTCFTGRFPKPGETVFGDDFDLGFGGKGANQAVAASYCGADAHMVARVGDDLFGPATVRNFEALGIGAQHVKVVKGAASGVAPIFVDKKGQNRIVVVTGANDRLTPAAVDRAAPLLKEADVVILQFEIPLETVYHVIQLARRHGVRCLLNPAPARDFELRRAVDVDYFIPNESEAEEVTGMRVSTVSEAKTSAAHLLDLGFGRVILTLGCRGVVVAGPDGIAHIPAFKVKTRDSTGAGDAFIGSFAAFLAGGTKERLAIEKAALYAALSTTSVGTQKSFVKRTRFGREWKARRAKSG
ncbi:MAG: ribokinase [Acidobacteriota bacterium]|nr:ribokinase [Acidobacteriota bacterium]